MALEYRITLDMEKSDRSPEMVAARVGDKDSVKITASLTNKGSAYTPSGANAYFECVTTAGTSVRIAATKSGSSVSANIPAAALVAPGVITCAYFRFENGPTNNPTLVESTQSFGIIVPDGIGANIEPEDYIEEWRGLQDKLQGYVDATKVKAQEAQEHIQDQADEIDTLKAQAMKDIAQDVTDVDNTAKTAKTTIAGYADDVKDAAADVTKRGDAAINAFNTKGNSAIDTFNKNGTAAINKVKTDGTSAINQFNTNAGNKLDEVDDMITEAQGDVNAAITQLENKTQDAIDAAQDALDGTTATNLQNAINRTLKLDVADMTDITNNASLSSFTKVGSYCCKTAASAAKISDSPVDDSPFNMYVFSSATSGQVMQLVVPIDMNGKPTAEWHVRFGTSSAMDKWSVIGGGADIAAGLGIDVTGDAKKTVSLDTDAFYQHHEAADIIQGSTEVTGGGRFKELTVYGNTRQNLWANPSGTSNGVTCTANADGSMTISGSTNDSTAENFAPNSYTLKPNTTYTVSCDKKINTTGDRACFTIAEHGSDGSRLTYHDFAYSDASQPTTVTFTTQSNVAYCRFCLIVRLNTTVSGTYRVMLNEGSTAKPWCPPGLNGVDELSVVCAGKNLVEPQFYATGYSYGYPIARSDRSLMTKAVLPYTNKKSYVGVGVYFYAVGGETYTLSQKNAPEGAKLSFNQFWPGQSAVLGETSGSTGCFGSTGVIPPKVVTFERSGLVFVLSAMADSSTGITWPEDFVIQVELGSTATDCEPPTVTTTHIDLDGHTLNSLPDGTRDELRIDGTGAVTLVKRVGDVSVPSGTTLTYVNENAHLFNATITSGAGTTDYENDYSDKLPVTRNLGASPMGVIHSTNANRVSFYANKTIYSSSDIAKTAVQSVLPARLLYPLAAPQTIELSPVTLPALPYPDYTVYASSNMPAEIEADVVKVDYLPPSDVYTKEEVDKKIEDAGMPDVVPVSQGGTGVTTAAAERNRLGLGDTTGALPVANGGTGATTAKAAQYNLLNSIATEDGSPEDSSLFTLAYVSPSSTNGALYKRTGSNVWNWIVSKIRSTFGFSSNNVLTVAKGGTGSTSAKAAQNSLLNDMNVSSDALTDSSMLVGYNASPSASNGAVHKRSALTIWNYVVGKIRSTFGFSSSNVLSVSHGGTGLTEAPSMLVNLESTSAANPLASDPRPGVSGELPLTRGGTGGTSAAAARTNLGVYSKAEVDGKYLAVQSGTGNLPSSLPNNTLYIQYV